MQNRFPDGAYAIELSGPWGSCSGRAIIRGGSVQAWSEALPGRVLMGVADAHAQDVTVELRMVHQPIDGAAEIRRVLPDSISLRGERSPSGADLHDDSGQIRMRMAHDLAARAVAG